MSGKAQQSFAVRRGNKDAGVFSASDLKQMALDGRLRETDEVSRPGDVWHLASTVRGLVFRAAKAQLPAKVQATQRAAPAIPKKVAAISPQIALQNPVSVLLNTLVTDRLSTLYQGVGRGELSEADFRASGAMILEQLQNAVAFLELKDSGQLKSGATKQTGGRSDMAVADATSNVRERELRRKKPESSASGFATYPVQSAVAAVQPPAGESGLGTVAKLAGAAALGGAFGYLLASQSRSYPGMSHGYGPGHGYGGGLPDGGFGGNAFQGASVGSGDSYSDNGTGVIGFDNNGDGAPDTFVSDSNSDGIADFRATDDDGDGLIDSFETDSDLDGRFDQTFVAQDESSEIAGLDEPDMTAESDYESMETDDELDYELESGSAELDDVTEDDDSFDSSDDGGDFDGGDMDFGE